MFSEPYPEFYQRLTFLEGTPPDQELLNSPLHLELTSYYLPHNKTVAMKALDDALVFIKKESEEIRERLKRVD